ncbi:Uncharacterized conserved protein, DUF2267 family [Pseudovibrio ascidiaceicola]|uniref:Uncharacterized conserved protein, DUF2267 family n=1 Tax=Pseudovibrio ascidiaceicola TaxID=285279 RepID=A0A1I3YZ12_9HYPH|nr:DUF2267 domain-containing protein [Pseudovibrio ascidiaceicola]SFK37112.1 Uncharacterized conserved protein, DUF2267 family [Pseudovibrio ascidiaceicola]
MPMPQEYQLASQQYESFLLDALESMDLVTRNRTYTCVQATLLAFRHRLTAEQVLLFADTLPAVLRAIFTAGWSRDDYKPEFGTMEDWAADAMALRRLHNFSDEETPARVAEVLRRHVDLPHFKQVLGQIGPDALQFWGFGSSVDAETKKALLADVPSQTGAL